MAVYEKKIRNQNRTEITLIFQNNTSMLNRKYYSIGIQVICNTVFLNIFRQTENLKEKFLMELRL